MTKFGYLEVNIQNKCNISLLHNLRGAKHHQTGILKEVRHFRIGPLKKGVVYDNIAEMLRWPNLSSLFRD